MIRRLHAALSRRWLRTCTRQWNRRMVEKGYHSAVIPLPSVRRSLKGAIKTLPTDARWALALWICPEIREELMLR